MSRTTDRRIEDKRVTVKTGSYKLFRQADMEYHASLKKLTYKQLLRISSAVTATTEREKYASRMFFRTLTPPEAKIVKLIHDAPNAVIKQRRLRTLNYYLMRKNKAEIEGVDINKLLSEAQSQEEL